MSITFEPTISLGNIISAVVIVAAVVRAAMSFSSRLAALELKVDTMWKAWLRETQRTHGIDEGCG